MEGSGRSSGRTSAPGRHVVLYDGACSFCCKQIRRLLRLAKPGAIEALSIQDPQVPVRFPGLEPEALRREMHLVLPDGRVVRGFEAAVRAVATRRFPWLIAYAYYIPGLRHLLDLAYAAIARNRYRLSRAGPCREGSCARHGGGAPPSGGA